MTAAPHSIKRALQIMGNWLNLPEDEYKAAVYRFAQMIPPEEVLAAAEIAQAKIPGGGIDAFRYFCGVCHSKNKERRIRLSWN